jgi:hypothetical protein
MLEMKIDPAMCMKIKGERQNVHPFFRLFSQEHTNGTTIDWNP